MSSQPSSIVNYNISGVKIHQENGEELIVAPVAPPWLVTVVIGGLFLVFGVIMLFERNTFLLAIPAFSLAVGLFSAYPIAARLTYNCITRQLVYRADYLLRFPRRIEVKAYLPQILRTGLRPQMGKSKRSIVDILLTDHKRISLDFGMRSGEAERVVDQLASPVAGTVSDSIFGDGLAQQADPQTEPVPAALEPVQTMINRSNQAALARELSSWRLWLLIIGVAQMFQAQRVSPWGLVLIMVGLASFYFRESPMLVVYGTTIAWAGLNNLLDGELIWKGFALLQIYWTYDIFRKYLKYRKAELAMVDPSLAAGQTPTVDPAARTRRLFPWLALGMGGGGLLGFIAAFVLVVLNQILFHSAVVTSIETLLLTLMIYLGLLGMGVGLAGWIARFPRKAASIIGCIGGALTLLMVLGIELLSRF